MSDHVAPTRLYYAIFAALMVLTAVTVAVAYRDLGLLNTYVAMTIAVAKATLVVLYFMHVRWSGRLVPILLAVALLWLVILVVLTMSDYASRGWLAAT
jgi:cytochrome c oxidase subunit 4